MVEASSVRGLEASSGGGWSAWGDASSGEADEARAAGGHVESDDSDFWCNDGLREADIEAAMDSARDWAGGIWAVSSTLFLVSGVLLLL